MTQDIKKPRLFYFEEAEDCWCPAPDDIASILDLESFSGDGDVIEIQFKRVDMSDAEIDNLEEV